MQDLLLNDGLLSGYGRLVGCGCSVGADQIPYTGVLWFVLSLLVAPGWVVGGEVPHNDCVFVMGQQVVQGSQIGYPSMC